MALSKAKREIEQEQKDPLRKEFNEFMRKHRRWFN